MKRCPACGQENPDGSRYCGACGAEVTIVAGEVRKLVTVLFCDLVGFTGASEHADPEAVRRMQLRYFEGARDALERHGGTVEKFIGDAVMAVFGVPRAHEDDAVRALRAALELRETVTDLRLVARIGISTGEVVVGAGDVLVTGDTVNVASRLEHAAGPGEILIGEETRRLARDVIEAEAMPPLTLKGKDRPVTTYRLLRVAGRTAPERSDEAPVVGRHVEMSALEAAFDRVVAERRCHVVTVIGAPGLGKTSLATAFASAVAGRAHAWTGHCLSYGEGITYWPLREIFDRAGDPAALDRAMAMPVREETFRAIRSSFEGLARGLPLVLVVEDLHWAEPTLLDLILHLADLATEAPILLVCLARPDLLEANPSWSEGRPSITVMELEALDPDRSERLLEEHEGWRGLDAPTRRRIIERAEGNPLFLEELLSMVVESARAGVADPRDSMPTTIQAVLLARLEQLDPDENIIAGVASVQGRSFRAAAVAEMAPPAQRTAVPAHLASLIRTRLVRTVPVSGPGDDDFEFRHQLIRDAAYNRLAKADRADLHERFGAWVERASDRGRAIDEVTGYHLEQAWRFRTDVDPDDPMAKGLASRAAARLSRAGARALGRSDMRAAAGLLRRAAALLEPGDPRRALVLPDLGAALTASGSLAEAEEILSQALLEARDSRDEVAEARASVEHVALRLMTDPSVGGAEASAEGERIVAALQGSGHDLILAKAWYLIGQAGLYTSRNRDIERAMRMSLDHAERAGELRQRSAALHVLSVGIAGGPTPVPDGIAEMERLRADVPEGSEAEGGLLVNLGVLQALAGRIEDARLSLERGRSNFRELGMDVWWAVYSMELAAAEFASGDASIAEAALREGCSALERMGERDFYSTAAAYLGRALAEQGKDEEAEVWAERSRSVAVPDDLPSQVTWRSTRARVLARRGLADEARQLASEAVELTDRGDSPVFTGDALMDLAEVLELAGEGTEALPSAARALRLYEQKGATALADRARARIARLTS